MTGTASETSRTPFAWFSALVFLVLCSFSGPALSEDAAADGTDVAIPVQLVAPGISTDELAYRLIPLTKSELEPLATTWQGIVRDKTAEISERQVALLNDPSQATDSAFQALARMVEERAALFERFSMVVDAFESKGGDAALIADFRAYRDSVLFNETILASPKAIALAFLSWLTRSDGGLAIAMDIGVVILAFVALLIVSRSARGLARRWIGRVPNISKLLEAFLVAAVFWLVIAVGLLFVLAALGVNVTPLFAMIGGASFILAFAFQDTLGNLASGLMIMINRPFDEGDYVLVGGVGGSVKSVSIVATTVITPDNQVIVIPNKNVWGNVITNVTASDTRRVDLVFGISYEDSIPDALRVIEETVRAHPLVLRDPEPTIRVHELAESSVNFICRPWTKTSDYWTVYWDLTHRMKEALTEAGLSIPYPQRDVHIRTGDV
ncbi:mechanosensitive ion channel family protein [Pseudohalocynthiibacter sp. F2068]|uniref:mechanosensitive ion channel family protein n=1 Tax=Pseudohalocynthiibacter sp. F2068 TaxID=2926418 RepID=UPI001FF3DC9A|nr:mechanosensitive ion channel family protein [Pseudohalocynthiibacter sp. F2068]MCK0103651.1 mechanosensitive ion channel family protein [Pseudohalocynthiibacter sp. F2068]